MWLPPMITHLKTNVVFQIALVAVISCAAALCYHYARLKVSDDHKPYQNLERVSMKSDQLSNKISSATK